MRPYIIHIIKGPTLLVNVALHLRTVYQGLKDAKAQIYNASCYIGCRFLTQFATFLQENQRNICSWACKWRQKMLKKRIKSCTPHLKHTYCWKKLLFHGWTFSHQISLNEVSFLYFRNKTQKFWSIFVNWLNNTLWQCSAKAENHAQYVLHQTKNTYLPSSLADFSPHLTKSLLTNRQANNQTLSSDWIIHPSYLYQWKRCKTSAFPDLSGCVSHCREKRLVYRTPVITAQQTFAGILNIFVEYL